MVKPLPSFVNYIIMVGLFFLATIIQYTIAPYATIFGASPNLIFVVFFLYMFFLPQSSQSPRLSLVVDGRIFFAMASGGFFLDILNTSYFGISMVALLVVGLAYTASRYFFDGMSSQFSLARAIILFLVCDLVFRLVFLMISRLFGLELFVHGSQVANTLYSLLIVIVGYYIWVFWLGRTPQNQLKLF